MLERKAPTPSCPPRLHPYNYPYTHLELIRLTNDNLVLAIVKVVLGNLQVERGGSTSDSSRDIVVRTVARAEPSSIISSLSDGDTTQVRAAVSGPRHKAETGEVSGPGEEWGGRTCDARIRAYSPDTQHDEPLGSLGSVAILLRVSQRLDVDGVGLVDLVRRSVSDENRLSSPFDDEVFAWGQRGSGGPA